MKGEIALMIIAYIVFFALIGTVVFGIAYFKASQEARVFNRFSGQQATTWDALFANLRVEACD